MKHYDYIITGAGAAGLSLLMHMMQHSAFDKKQILVADKSLKNTNDRTWCFWETKPGLFEPVVHHRWQQVHFFSDYFSSQLNLSPYTYKMIRGIDLYNCVLEQAKQKPNIHFVQGEVSEVGNEGNNAIAIINNERFTATHVFNSILFNKPSIKEGEYFLLQHFKGKLIRTAKPVFNPGVATLMDFRVSQKHGTTFIYVLPLSTNEALVEYTLFTKELLPQNEYDEAISNYISLQLNIDDYEVLDEEFGVIPMTNHNFMPRIGNVINIGTAGGQTKPSSGYTFSFIQKHSKQIVSSLLEHNEIKIDNGYFKNRFKLYDSTLLNILHNNKLGGDRIFADLFKKNPPDRVLRFLDNESNLMDELKIMGSVPSGVFLKAAIHEMFR